jgi:hypothetical protein
LTYAGGELQREVNPRSSAQKTTFVDDHRAPREGHFDDIERRLGETLGAVRNMPAAQRHVVILVMAKFASSSSAEFNKPLEVLGMRTAFSDPAGSHARCVGFESEQDAACGPPLSEPEKEVLCAGLDIACTTLQRVRVVDRATAGERVHVPDD